MQIECAIPVSLLNLLQSLRKLNLKKTFKSVNENDKKKKKTSKDLKASSGPSNLIC